MSKAQRWKKSIARSRRRTLKRKFLEAGWTLKTHTDGTIFMAPPNDLQSQLTSAISVVWKPAKKDRSRFSYNMPKRSLANKFKKDMRRRGIRSFRKYMSRQW